FDISPEEFQHRVDWAGSQGHPRWLWPEVSIEEWRRARETLTRVAGEVLGHGVSDRLLDGAPVTMSIAAYTAGIGPLLGWWIREGRVRASAEIASLFDLHLRHNRLRMERMRTRAIEVIEAFDRRGIDAGILKGMHTAFTYFPDPSTRPASDIDLVVRPDHAATADMILDQAGFTCKYRSSREASWAAPDWGTAPSSLLLTHVEDPWTVDLHHSLDYQPRPTVPPAHLDLIAPISGTQPWPAGPLGTVLAQPLLLLHIATHAGCPVASLTPLRMIEIALIIRRDRASGALQWEEFLDQARAAGALGLIFPALFFTDQLVPGTIPGDVLEASAAATPRVTRRYLARFTPATIQAVHRISLAERLMWSEGWFAAARQIGSDFLPAISSAYVWRHYLGRVFRKQAL
ncbi:MAG TPA: nucleotidyltransferase family protein, partial [Sphingomonas sp.]|nr:nucleotidyltransferase family protein [Sphingomonas sp.]